MVNISSDCEAKLVDWRSSYFDTPVTDWTVRVIGHDRFFPHPVQCTVRYPSCNFTLRTVTDSVV